MQFTKFLHIGEIDLQIFYTLWNSNLRYIINVNIKKQQKLKSLNSQMEWNLFLHLVKIVGLCTYFLHPEIQTSTKYIKNVKIKKK